jgi:DNA polymerase I-like protein with 3'-5' exonuclease and polymerase domains
VSVFTATFGQGGEADVMKHALALLHRRLKPVGGRILTILHDEVVAGGPRENAEAIKAVLVECMSLGMATFIKLVPVKVDAYISNSWAKP